MVDMSKEYWFMSRKFIQIHYNYPGVTFYTTDSIREKYGIESLTRPLPRLQKIAPDWAYLSDMPYIHPPGNNLNDYLIVYELSIGYKYNLSVYLWEPDDHPFLVIRDNSQIIEIKLFKFNNGEHVLVKDYY